MVIKKCSICGKKIKRYPCQIKGKKDFVCSKKCSIKLFNQNCPRGKNHYHWNGGIRKRNGYIQVLKPTHPFCDSKGYVMQHRLVMEKYIKRFLHPWEIIHHKNRILTDNRIKNLEITTQEIHGRNHNIGQTYYKKRTRNKKGQFI